MSIRLKFNPRANITAQQICQAYWTFDNNSDFISYVYQLCSHYNVTTYELFNAVEQCYACFDEVSCQSCGCYYPLEVPADIPYIQAQKNWVCKDCEHFSGKLAVIN